MRKYRHYRWVLSGLLAAMVVSVQAGESVMQSQLAAILASEARAEGNSDRDQYRNPIATLDFFEVTPQQTVVEIWPGRNGWYTEILAPLLREGGQLYCAHWSEQSSREYFRDSRGAFDEKLAAQPQVYDRVKITILEPPDAIAIAPAGTADRVLTFRNVHNWMKAGQADAVFAAMFSALKPGGLLGVVEHRAPAGTAEEVMINSGYVTEARVIELAERAGFEFAGESEINANPLDSADHPNGVWSLPPSLRGGDVDRSSYLEIGESDRMTLKFRRPMS
jgi:predicted methyltransferase